MFTAMGKFIARIKRRSVFVLLTLITLPLCAEVFVWVDGNGRKHFSDQKPIDQVAKVRTFSENTHKDRDSLSRQQAMNAFLNQQSKDKAQKEKQSRKNASASKKKQAKCAFAKRRIQHNKAVSVMYSLNDKGERIVWTDAQRVAYTKKLSRRAKTLCH